MFQSVRDQQVHCDHINIFMLFLILILNLFLQVYEISMSTVIKMECDDCSPAKLIEEETVSHIREKVTD